MIEIKSSALLTHTGTALTDGDTVTIGSRVYTYKTVLTGAANEVLIGAATASLANLKAAVNGAAGAGTTYGVGTVAHADVDATTLNGSTSLLFEAKVAGVAGNAIAKGETSTNLSWNDGTAFSGGATYATSDNIPVKVLNVFADGSVLVLMSSGQIHVVYDRVAWPLAAGDDALLRINYDDAGVGTIANLSRAT